MVKTKHIIITMVVLGILTGMLYYGGLFSIVLDDYLIEDDFMLDGYSKEHWSYTEELTMGSLQLSTNWQDISRSTTYDVNIKDKDIKIKLSVKVGGCGTNTPQTETVSLRYNDISIFSDTVSVFGKQSTNSDDYLIEIIKDVTDSDVFVVYVNGDAVKEITVVGEKAVLTVTASQNNNCGSKGGGSVIIDYVNYKPYFSCEIEEGEVIISDSFNEGSKLDITDLTYSPTKFCPLDFPAIVRDFEAVGLKSDTRGTITNGLARGSSYTVPSGQTYEIRYITRYNNNILDRCNIGEVYDTSTHKCVLKVSEQAEIIKIIRDTEFISVGKNEKPFINSLVIGDKQITSAVPVFLCADTKPEWFNQDWNAPQPESDCWETTVSYKGKDYVMKDMDEIVLDNYLSLSLRISAHYEQDIKAVDTYKNNFVLKIKDYGFITTEPVMGDSDDYYVIFNTPQKMCFNINNKLGVNFAVDNSGYSLKKTTDLITTQKRTVVSQALRDGTTPFCIDVDSGFLGETFYEIVPYVKFGDEIFFDNENVIYNYNIVYTVPEAQTEVCKDRECVLESRIENKIIEDKKQTSTTFWIIITGMLVLGIGAIIYIIKKR